MENKDLPKSSNTGFIGWIVQFLRSEEVQHFLKVIGDIIEGVAFVVRAGTELIDMVSGGINRRITR